MKKKERKKSGRKKRTLQWRAVKAMKNGENAGKENGKKGLKKRKHTKTDSELHKLFCFETL